MFIYKLQFTSPLHIGVDDIHGQEKSEQMLHSDTIFSAIISTWSLLFKDDIDALCCEPKFIVSSAFPFIQDKLFFPVPIGFTDEIMNKTDDIKFWKKLDYIPEDFLKIFLSKGRLDISDFDKLKKYITNESKKNEVGERGTYNKSKLNFKRMMERPRIGINRLTNSVSEEAFFYSGDVEFINNAGLFFFTDFDNDETITKFDAAMRLLADNGIGADRAVGRGQFTFTKEKTDFKRNHKTNNQLLLSCLVPTENEVKTGFLEKSEYKLIFRSGNVYDYRMKNIRKKKLTMLGEGSIIRSEEAVSGAIIKVVDKNESNLPINIYRDGRAFTLGMEGGKK